MKKIFTIVSVLSILTASAQKQLSGQMAATAFKIFSSEDKNTKWNYDEGVVLKGIEGIWNETGDGKYFKFIQNRMDVFVDKSGSIKTYKQEDYNLDNINNGRVLLLLYK